MSDNTTKSLESIFRIGLRLTFVAAALLLFAGVDSGSLLPSDDSIYARAAIESFRSGRLIDVTWMGSPIFEKGPVLFGALELAGALKGPLELGARLPGIIAGLFVLMLVFRLARDFGFSTWASLVAAGFCLATNLFYFNARRPMTDIPGLLFALAGLRLTLFSPDSKRSFVGGALFGLSALCKLTAPVPFIAALAVIRFMRRRTNPGLRDLLWVIAGAAAAFIPWHAAMFAMHGMDFVRTYFGYHLFFRMGHTIIGDGAAVTYIGWLVERDLPAMLLFVPCAIVTILLAVKRDERALAAIVLTACALLPLMVSSTALPHYLIPVLPGVALIVGLTADTAIKAWKGSATGKHVIMAVLAACCVAAFVSTNMKDLRLPDYGHDSKALCQIMLDDRSGARIAGTFDLHDPAIPLYCDKNMKFFGHNPGYVSAVKDIPMLHSVFQSFKSSDLADLADIGGILVTDKNGRDSLSTIATELGLTLKVREFGTRFAVEPVKR